MAPPRFAVWLSKKNDTCRTAVRAGALGVHALGPGDEALAGLGFQAVRQIEPGHEA